jgi:RNA polymerase sigma factor (TIGR02999 family)
MSQPDADEITRLLQAHHQGDDGAFDRLVPLVYDRMRRIARGQLARQRRGETVDTTSLVHETYMQLIGDREVDWQDRSHFFAICARAMRRILVDHARRRTARKRGGSGLRVTLDADVAGGTHRAELILAVDRALGRLATFNERLARVVECRVFAGMTEQETAQALETSLRTVQREWTRARAWLRQDRDLDGLSAEGGSGAL